MAEPIILPPGVALAIIAFLLSLLPAGFFIWLWYLRGHGKTTPAKTIVIAFLLGGVSVWPAFYIETVAEEVWQTFWPATAHYFVAPILPLLTWQDILLPALGTFAIVALVEEGIRYVIMRVWLKRSRVINQIFDGLLVGIAMGVGFATIENTMYFLNLFQGGEYNTLVFVFFLRFLVSTLAHISFAGLMGAFIARGVFDMFATHRYYLVAFFFSWFLHGAFDLFLGLGIVLYAVLILAPALVLLVLWMQRRDFLIIHRKEGQLLAQSEAPQTREVTAVTKLLQKMDSPWNEGAPWLNSSRNIAKIFDTLKK